MKTIPILPLNSSERVGQRGNMTRNLILKIVILSCVSGFCWNPSTSFAFGTVKKLHTLHSQVQRNKPVTTVTSPRLEKCLTTYASGSAPNVHRGEGNTYAILNLLKAFIDNEYLKRRGMGAQYQRTKDLIYNIGVPVYDQHALGLLKFDAFYAICEKRLNNQQIADHLNQILLTQAGGSLRYFQTKIEQNPQCFPTNDPEPQLDSSEDTWDYHPGHPIFKAISKTSSEKGVYLAHMLRLKNMKKEWIASKFEARFIEPMPDYKDPKKPFKVSLSMISPEYNSIPVPGTFLGIIAKPQTDGLVATAVTDLFSNRATTEQEITEMSSKANASFLEKHGLLDEVPKDPRTGYGILKPSLVLRTLLEAKENNEIVYSKPLGVLGYILYDLKSKKHREALFGTLSDDLSGPSENFIGSLDSLFLACNRMNLPILWIGESQNGLDFSEQSRIAFPNIDSIPPGKVIGKGSTRPELITLPDGTQFVKKNGGTAGSDPKGHVENEYFSNLAFKALGVPVPESELYKPSGANPFMLTQYIKGHLLRDFTAPGKSGEFQKIRSMLKRNFVANCLLGNYDVIGSKFDNILVDEKGVPHQIDNGSGLEYRAQGKKKEPFSDEVIELDILRGTHPSPDQARWAKNAAVIYGDITDEEIVTQIDEIISKRKVLLHSLPTASLQKKIDARIKSLLRYKNRVLQRDSKLD